MERIIEERIPQWICGKDIFENIANLQQVIFEVTDACNLACDYCTYRELFIDHDERHGKYMKSHTAIRLLEYLISIWNTYSLGRSVDQRVIGFYGGEPLMNMPFIKEVISYLESNDSNRVYNYSMTTNALLLDRYIDYLVEKKVKLLISLDGDIEGNAHRHTHDGKSSYSKVKTNALLVKQRYPEYYEKYVSFNSVLHNLNSIESITKSIFDTFGKYPSIAAINSRGLDPKKKDEFTAIYKRKNEKITNATQLIGDSFSILRNQEVKNLTKEITRLSGNYFHKYHDLLCPQAISFYPCPGTCSPFSRKMFVTVNGKILQCERIGQNYSWGIITEDDIEIDVDDIAAKFNALIHKVHSMCRICPGWKVCDKCVFYLNETPDGKLECETYSKSDLANLKAANRALLLAHPELYELITKELIIK